MFNYDRTKVLTYRFIRDSKNVQTSYHAPYIFDTALQLSHDCILQMSVSILQIRVEFLFIFISIYSLN